MSSPLLDFLTHDLAGPERDAVTRAFYEYAQGDPNSHPVGMAVMLTVCVRKMNILPLAVRGQVEEMRNLAKEVAQVEKDLLEKLTRENFSTHSAIKEEAAQLLQQFKTECSRNLNSFTGESRGVQEAWKEVVATFGKALIQCNDVHFQLKPIVESADRISRDFHSVQGGLKLHENISRQTLEAVNSLKLIHQENQKQAHETQAMVRSLTTLAKHARANWISLGYMAGMVLAAFCVYLPWWAIWAVLGLGLVLLQWLSRISWQRKKARKPLNHIREA